MHYELVPILQFCVFAVLSYISGTADSSDYTIVSTTVTLPAGAVMSTEVPIVITGDNIVEDDEDFTVTLGMTSEPTGFVNTDAITTHATSISSEITIDDDDTRKNFYIITEKLQSHCSLPFNY